MKQNFLSEITLHRRLAPTAIVIEPLFGVLMVWEPRFTAGETYGNNPQGLNNNSRRCNLRANINEIFK